MNQDALKLSQLIIQEKHLADSLFALMLQEKNILEENSPDKLSAITADKANCLDKIEIVSRNRSQLLLAVSTAPTTVERLQQFIAQQTTITQESLNVSVQQLENILEKCRHQNSVNGMVISMSQRNVQRNLNIIKGIDHESMTYTQKGQTTSVGQKLGGIKA